MPLGYQQFAAAFRAYNTEEVEQIYDDSALFSDFMESKIQKQTINQEGYEHQFRNDFRGAVSFIPAGGDHPRPISMNKQRMHVFATEGKMTMSVDGRTYANLTERGNEVARRTFTKWTQEVDAFKRFYRHYKEVLNIGDGSGAMGYVAGTSTTTQIDVVATPDARYASGYGSRMLRPEVYYDLVDLSTNTVVSAGITFSGPGSATNSMALSVALGAAPAAGLAIVASGSHLYNPKGFTYLAPSGLRTGMFQNLPVSGKQEYQHVVTDAGGRYNNASLMQKFYDKVFHQYPSRAPKYQILCSQTQVSAFVAPGYGQAELTTGETKYGTNLKQAHHLGRAFNAFPYWPANLIHMHDLSEIVRLCEEEDGWVEKDGRMMRELPGAYGTGKSEYAMVYGGTYNLALKTPNVPAVLFNLGVSGYNTIGDVYSLA